MTRPAFLSRPELWTRTPRMMANAVDQACALQRSSRHASVVERIADVVLAVVLGIVAAAGIWHWLAQ